jgi:serine phosphatase RsbU (regulator of sigma subunit)
MAIRYRTRLSIAIGLLIAVAISATSLLILLSTMLGLAENYYSFGTVLTRVGMREIASGLETDANLKKLSDEQLTVSALLAAELVHTAERGEKLTSDEVGERLDRVLERTRELTGANLVDEISVRDKDGNVYIKTDPIAHDETVSTGPEISEVTPADDRASDVSTTVDGVESRGIVGAGMDEDRIAAAKHLVQIQSIVDRFVQDTDVARVVVLDTERNVLAARDRSGRTGPSVADSQVLGFCGEYQTKAPNKLYDLQDFGGDVGVVTNLLNEAGEMSGTLFIQHDTTQAADLARVIMIQIFVVGAMITFIAIWVSNYLSKDFSKPIDVLARGAREFGKGNLAHRVETPSQDEFGNLADAFNSMAGSLQEHMSKLEAETRFRERLQSELSIASELQRSLLPVSPPDNPAIQVAGWSVAAKEVGGDFYDYMEIANGGVGIAIGDATGKGLPAALLVTECWSVLKALAVDTRSVSELLFRTNNALCRRLGRSGRFVTLFCMVVDPNRGVLRYASAGHNPPILIGTDGVRVKSLQCRTGLPLGILPNCRYGEYELALHPGDTILLYSDGLTDAHDPADSMYGNSRLHDVVMSLRGRPIEEVVAGLRIDVVSYMQGRDMFDDMTVLGVRFIQANSAVA